MSTFVQFLEALGGNAATSRLSVNAYASAVQALGLEASLHQAMLARDVGTINRLLGGREQVRCFVFVPD